MALDPAPIGEVAAELMDELEDEFGLGAELLDAIVLVEVKVPNQEGEGEDRFHIRYRATTEPPTQAFGMLTFAADSVRRPAEPAEE